MADAPVIVVGAGIAGLTCALALARSGRPVTLIEKRTHLEEVGAGLQLSPNARHILVDTEAKAKDIIAQLNAGAKFEDLAKKNGDPDFRRAADLQKLLDMCFTEDASHAMKV